MKKKLTINTYETGSTFGGLSFLSHMFLDENYVGSFEFDTYRDRDKEQPKNPILQRVEKIISNMFENSPISIDSGKEKQNKEEKYYIQTFNVNDQSKDIEFVLEKMFNKLLCDGDSWYKKVMNIDFHKVETKKYGDGIARSAKLEDLTGSNRELKVGVEKYISETRHKKTNKLLATPDYKTNLEEYISEVKKELVNHILKYTGVRIKIINTPTYSDFKENYKDEQAKCRGILIFKFKVEEIVDNNKFHPFFSSNDIEDVILFNLITDAKSYKKDLIENITLEKEVTLRLALRDFAHRPQHLYEILKYEQDFLNDKNSIKKLKDIFAEEVFSRNLRSIKYATLALRNFKKIMPELYKESFGDLHPSIIPASYLKNKNNKIEFEKTFNNFEIPNML